MKKIPVHLITGFLGAGKTTFLNHFIKERQPERILVIENEVGKANVDSQLVIEKVKDIVELTAGCLCCSLNDELFDVLEEVSARRSEFDCLVIETTGVADPGGVMQAFLAHSGVEKVFDLRNVICVVDAKNLINWLEQTDEARRQIVVADAILVNKLDIVDPDSMATLQPILKGINPFAHIFGGEKGIFPIQTISDIEQIQATGIEKSSATIQNQHNHKHHNISTFMLTFDRAFDLKWIAYELVRMVRLYPDQIYRIKGIIEAHDRPTKVIIQSVRDSVVLSDGSEWQAEEKREGKVVVIGKDLDKKVIEAIFKRHLVK